MTLVARQAGAAGLASLVLVAGILFAALRALRPALAIVLALVVGLVWAASFAALAVGHLNLISVAFAVLFIGLSTDFGLHLVLRQREVQAGGVAERGALERAAREVGPSIALCAASTAIGFYAFVPTDFRGVAELGVIAGTGMFIGLVANFTVLPAVLAAWPAPGRVAPQTPLWLPRFPVRQPRFVAAIALLGGGVASVFLARVAFDPNPLNVRDPSAESVRTFRELLAESRSSPWSLDVLAESEAAAAQLVEELEARDAVAEARSVHDYVPAEQDEKLALLADASFFLGPKAKPPREVLGSEATLASLRALSETLRGSAGNGDDGAAAPRLPARFERASARAAASLDRWLGARGGPGTAASEILAIEADLLGSLPRTLERLERMLSARRIGVDSLPDALRERMLSPEGRLRVRVFPSEELDRADQLGRFVDEVREVAPLASGPAIDIVDASRAVVTAFQQAMVAASLAIAAMLVLLWRRLGDVALVLAVLALATVLTGSATVWLGIPFNFANVIVLPLILGIGVDSGIHLVHRARLGDVGTGALLSTSTARAVVFSSLTTIASFGSLGFASHRGIASLGQLLTLGVVLTLLSNLVVLPALIALRANRSAEPVS